MKLRQLVVSLALLGLLSVASAASAADATASTSTTTQATGASSAATSSSADATTSASGTTSSPTSSAGGQQVPLTPTEAATQKPQQISGQGTPVREKQTVFSVSPYNGHDYSNGVFAPQQLDTVYMIANHTNMVDTLQTNVYYWPITQEYMADWFGLKKDVPGQLQVWQGGKLLKTVSKQDYNFMMPDGYSGLTELRVGKAADQAYQDYNDATNSYWSAVNKYYSEQQTYQTTMQKILDEVQKTKQYRDPSSLPQAPTQPSPPTMFATQPVTGFELNLPPGNYTLKLVDKDGKPVADATKKVVSFAPRRSGLGFSILPESKWTKSFNSDDSTSVLYQASPNAIYIKPYDEQEYNVLDYTKATDLDKPLNGAGLGDAWMWVHSTNERTGLTLQLLQDGKVIKSVKYQGYFVQQTPGYALGYNVVPFDPNASSMQGQQATFSAYRVFTEKPGNYTLRFVDQNGKVLPGSVRYFRTVETNAVWPIYAIPFFPLLVGLCIFFWRRGLRNVRHTESQSAVVANA